jgi:hypothetical protein
MSARCPLYPRKRTLDAVIAHIILLLCGNDCVQHWQDLVACSYAGEDCGVMFDQFAHLLFGLHADHTEPPRPFRIRDGSKHNRNALPEMVTPIGGVCFHRLAFLWRHVRNEGRARRQKPADVEALSGWWLPGWA